MQGFESLLLPAIRRISDRLERATVASEVASYLGIDRSLVLTEFRKAQSPKSAQAARPPHESIPLTERILIRSMMLDAEVRAMLLPRLQSSSAARRYTVWPLLNSFSKAAETGGDFSFEAIEAGLEEIHRPLLSGALFADSSEEVLSPDQVAAFVRMLEINETKLAEEALRFRLKEAERAGNAAHAFSIMEELNRLQKGERS